MADNGTSSSYNFRLYTPAGVEVLFHVVTEYMDGKTALDGIAALVADGFLPQRPSLEAGEEVYTVDAVCRSTKIEDDGRETPIIAFYPINFSHPALKKYLNSADDAAAFERVTGLKIAKLPDYIGKDSINRNEADKRQLAHVVAVKPFDIVWKPNPNYEEGGTKPKRYFVRYKGDVAPEKPADKPQADEPQKPLWWKEAVTHPSLVMAYGKARDSVLRTLLNDGKVTMDTPVTDVLALALKQDESGDIPF